MYVKSRHGTYLALGMLGLVAAAGAVEWLTSLRAHAADVGGPAPAVLEHVGGRIVVGEGSSLRRTLAIQSIAEQVVEVPFALPASVEADSARLVKVLPPLAGHIVSLDKRLGDPVQRGEVLGIAGVSGNGQAELLAALSGEDSHAGGGSLSLLGTDVTHAGPTRRRKLGLHFVPEERLGRATVPSHSLSNNALLTRQATLPPSFLRKDKPLRRLAMHLIERFSVKASGPNAAARSLSGGNLQKYVVGREIDAAPRVLVVAQPTWGVDVGAAAQIRAEILKLRDTGSAVLLVSEELDELVELSDTLRVMAAGRLSPPLSAAAANRSLIGEWMSGLWPENAAAKAQQERV